MNPNKSPAHGAGAHTPGPWIVQYFGPYRDISITTPRAENRIPIFQSVAEAWTKNGMPREVAEANARLIASAPDLLAACREALAYVQSQPDAPQGSIAEVAQCGVRYVLKNAIHKTTPTP